jgi:hypothetical protein
MTKRRLATIALTMALMVISASPVAAAGVLDFGSVSLGGTATRNHELPLAYALSEVPSETVLYTGGDGIIDSALTVIGLTAPVTAGSLYGALGEVSATFHLSFGLSAGTDFSIDGSACASGSGSCTAVVEFSPTAPGLRSAAVTVSMTSVVISNSGPYASYVNLFAPALVPSFEDQLGFTVTGVGTEGGSGGLLLEVAVAPEPVPCLIVDASSIDFGTLAFSTEAETSSASRNVSATSCSTGPEEIFAAGTDAAGDGVPAAAWALSSVGGNPCGIGFDAFGVALTADLGAGPLPPLQLSATNSPWLELDAEASAATAVDYQMPCEGSAGAGQTMSSQITFLAIAP